MNGRYRSGDAIRLYVYIEDANGAPATGLLDVQVRIRRLNGDWADFTGPNWTATGTALILTEVDATRAPGVYEATFTPSSFAGANATDDYLAVFTTTTPGNSSNTPQHQVLQVGDWVNAVYQMQIQFVRDVAGVTDRYTAIFHKDTEPITTGITGTPTLQVINAADGLDLIPASAMTEIPVGSGRWRYQAVTTQRQTPGVHYIARVVATIDGVSQDWHRGVGRDST
jgi:hypothetical protein